ncbi:prolyl oligopeptidase [Pseudomassariella vexata]|uniref:Dipeptidyl-peptidase V n=1 Tax=Pseudomassariella vexata TaxID=1141098 RepID=A0A1Y2E0T9_9PEZI|nr:prolyl oligopeptidase [Pseudomassariella vexata]ORY65158.1 prolyl oligopeptidase [Pseudomassariella vexata]
MVLVPKFTPELLTSAPRRGPAVPNHNGTLALFTQTTHTIGEEKALKEIRVMNIQTGESTRLVEDEKAHDALWLGDGTNTVIYLKSGGVGITWIMMADADNPSLDPYIVDDIQAPVNNLKVRPLKDGSIAFVVVGFADKDGQLYNEESNKKPHTARVCDSYDVRIWDAYKKPQRYAIWYTTFVKEDDKWRFNKPLKNAVAGTTLEAPINMYQPSNSTDDFDISDKGIVFAGREFEVGDPTMVNISSVYYVLLESYVEVSSQGPRKIAIQSNVDKSYCSHPRFSPDGSMIAFLRAPYGRGTAVSIYVNHLDSPRAINVFTMVTGKKWTLIPASFEFAPSGYFVYITADDCGRVGLYRLDLQPNAYPKTLLRSGAVSAYHPLKQDKDDIDRVLVTSSNLIQPSIFQIVDGDRGIESEPYVISTASQLTNLGLSPRQVSEIYFEGGGDYCVQAWVVKPRDFDPSREYPLLLQVHGGPISAWNDAWSTTWNPAVWAEQGYVVVCPNITGSTGFGLDFSEAVLDNFGGRPYDDLVNCLEYVKNMPGVDTVNAIAAGGSYGGYMMNWIQGHELGRKFKALVCHDGIFHIPTFMLQSDFCDTDGVFGGPPFMWANIDGLERYNPARPDLLNNWTTPMLIIHSEKDYRCPVTDGVAAFHTLKALGTPARFVNFPDENHVVLKEENSLEWHRLVFEWINQWSGVAAKNMMKGLTRPV